MKINFKLLFLCVIVVFAVLFCLAVMIHTKNKNEEKNKTMQIVNPMKKSTPQEIIETIGVKFNEPMRSKINEIKNNINANHYYFYIYKFYTFWLFIFR